MAARRLPGLRLFGLAPARRMIRASLLDATVYDEIAADPSRTRESVLVFLVAVGSSLIGSNYSAGVQAGLPSAASLGIQVMILLVGLPLSPYIALVVGTRVLKGSGTYGRVLRTCCFAGSPYVLGGFSLIPVVGGAVPVVLSVWAFMASVVGLRQALRLTTRRALVGVIITYGADIVVLAAMAIILIIFYAVIKVALHLS